MESEESANYKEGLPFLAQLVSGSYEEEKRKKSLAHERGEGASCSKCGTECSGFELHFWRKVCKNCGCKPQDHEIQVKQNVHTFIVNNLFEAKDGTNTLAEPQPAEEESVTKDKIEVKRAGSITDNRKMEIPKIEITEAKNLVPVPPPRKESYREMQKYRQRMSQLPPQDFDPKYCNTLNRKEKQAMNKLADTKRSAAGRGKVIDFNGLSSLSCEGCGKSLKTGEKAVFIQVKEAQKQWHADCFKCFSCNEQIADFIYFLYEDNIYCGRHYAEKFRERCAACDELIYADKFTKAEGKAWHREHFVCFLCEKDLADTSYVSHKNQPHCIMCYHLKVANKCKSCCLPIAVGEERITHENMHWHACPECFFCHGCNKSLVDAGFMLKDYKTYCSTKCSRN